MFVTSFDFDCILVTKNLTFHVVKFTSLFFYASEFCVMSRKDFAIQDYKQNSLNFFLQIYIINCIEIFDLSRMYFGTKSPRGIQIYSLQKDSQLSQLYLSLTDLK